jgi:hypothetical protein
VEGVRERRRWDDRETRGRPWNAGGDANHAERRGGNYIRRSPTSTSYDLDGSVAGAACHRLFAFVG